MVTVRFALLIAATRLNLRPKIFEADDLSWHAFDLRIPSQEKVYQAAEHIPCNGVV